MLCHGHLEIGTGRDGHNSVAPAPRVPYGSVFSVRAIGYLPVFVVIADSVRKNRWGRGTYIPKMERGSEECWPKGQHYIYTRRCRRTAA